MTSSKILFYLCLCFIAGIGLESVMDIPQFVLWIFLFLAVSLIFIKFISIGNNDAYAYLLPIVGFCVLVLVLGVLRMQIAEFNIANDKLSKFNNKGEIILEGMIMDGTVFKDNSQRIKVKVGDSAILVTVSRYPEFSYLDKVKITGKLQTPMETEDFSYKNYLLKDHIYSVMFFPKIEKTGRNSGDPMSAIFGGILWIKNKLRQSIRSNFLPPHSSILEGIILGDKNAISREIKDKFRITGLSHIVAVSGMHIVILSGIIMHFLLLFGFNRNSAFYAVIIFIFSYVVLAGAPSSAVRAGIMAVIYLLGQKFGRQTMSSRIIVLAGGIMLLFNPLFLFFDVGFQLSFLAVFGLILLEPLIKIFIKFLLDKFFKFKIKEKYGNALSLFTVTISAQIFTLPIIIFNFGSVSLVSLFTNILILPAIPIVMFFGFLSAVAGMFFGFFGWLLSLPSYFLLSYIFAVIDIFSGRWAYKIISNVSWIWPVVSYLFLGAFIKYLTKKLRQNFLDY